MIMIDDSDIAIVGMACRFPGANSYEEYWQNLCAGQESISFFSDEELLASGVDPAELANPNYVKAGGVLSDVELFDASFFAFSPREAEMLDPQHRLFLECAASALQDAGYNANTYEGLISLYAGVGMNSYLLRNLLANPKLIELVGIYQLVQGNDKDFLPTRVSYKLNLTGPSVTVQTACSTSLVAVHLACQSLLNGESDMALAGGVSIRLPQKKGYLYQQGMINSPDGHCRAFDAQAQGTVGGNGLGIVVLKRLEDALTEGDYIHAVIKGSAINNDGSLKAGYTAPSVAGQAKVISEAQAVAGVDPETITYIEAHGTGTVLGDPIEMAALMEAFQPSEIGSDSLGKGVCAIGSVKTNIGHTDTASGVAGLIKTALALKHKMIPPSLHFSQPNPKIDFANSPFYVNHELSEWDSSTPRRAGVSSFGIGGTNAHVILQEAPPRDEAAQRSESELLLLSAKSATALDTATAQLAEHLRHSREQPEINLADVAYTLQVGRQRHRYRRMLLCQGLDEAVSALTTGDGESLLTTFDQSDERPVVFMFPGQGTQYINMGRELYEGVPTFRQEVDHCAALLKPILGLDLRQILYPTQERATEASTQLKKTAITQPALFVIEYATANLWRSWGVQPRAMIGHSIGEYVAACLAGVFSLPDALALVAIRGRLMQSLDSYGQGGMLAVSLSEEKLKKKLKEKLTSHDAVSVAAMNGPSLSVLSGAVEAIARLEKQLTAEGVACRPLHTSHAFHSEMMDPILDAFKAEVQKIKLSAPQRPYIANVTGTWITDAEATSASYWVQHLRQTVRFGPGLAELVKEAGQILLEVGPGRTLSTLAKQQLGQTSDHVVLRSLPHARESQAERPFLLTTLGQLWLAGAAVDWSGFHAHQPRQRLPLPTYPFERQRYWIDAPVSGQADQSVGSARLTSLEKPKKKPDMADWFYLPSWKRSPPMISSSHYSGGLGEGCWVLFVDECGLGEQLATNLSQQGVAVITVKRGATFNQLSEHLYTLNPRQPDEYVMLLNQLSNMGFRKQTIVHLWPVSAYQSGELTPLKLESSQDLGFYSLLYLAQALGKQNLTDDLTLAVISTHMHEVIGEELRCPEKATLLGAVKIIPLEYPNISCRSIDVAIPESGCSQTLTRQLLAELSADRSDLVVAYRGKHRWVQSFEPVRLEKPAEEPSRLREAGVYLITGGLGGIGLALAEHLAQTVQAKLVLTGRSSFPPREEWAWAGSEDEGMAHKIRNVQRLEALGAEVLVLTADVSNEAEMQAVMKRTEQRFGPLNGVIHSAGVVDYAGVIQRRTREMTDAILAPKVQGTVILDRLLKNTTLDFMVLCSSGGTVLYHSKFGEVGYCAANEFLDAFAYYKTSQDGVFTVAINWNDWQEVGMSVEAQKKLGIHDALVEQSMLDDGLLSSEGIEVFRRILAHPLPRVLVSTGDLTTLLEQDHAVSTTLLETLQQGHQVTHQRPTLKNPYVAPRNEVEHQVAKMWQALLGIKEVGIHDDFFELGGHSLLATQVISQVRDLFAVSLSLASLFEEPTVAELADYIEASQRIVQGMSRRGAELGDWQTVSDGTPTERADAQGADADSADTVWEEEWEERVL